MKKLVSIFLTLIICVFISSCAFSEPLTATIKKSVESYVPQWDEFCPPEYINAKYTTPLPAPLLKETKIPGFWATINPFSSAWSKYEKENGQCWKDFYKKVADCESVGWGNYWFQRHKAFDGEIRLCLADENTANTCFMQVRQMEDNKTAQKNNQQAQQAQAAQQAQQAAQQAAQFAAQQAAQSAQIMMQSVNNFQTQMQGIQAQQQAQQLNNNINNLNANLNSNLNKSNASLSGINHSLNKIEQSRYK